MKRPDTIKVDCSSILGEGASLTWKRLTWGERQAMREEYSALPKTEELKEREEYAFQFILSHLVDWNWEIPLLKTREDFDRLYSEEREFLYGIFLRAMNGHLTISDEDLKN